jgi:hypothetical protein
LEDLFDPVLDVGAGVEDVVEAFAEGRVFLHHDLDEVRCSDLALNEQRWTNS